jgi:hypothetical protein
MNWTYFVLGLVAFQVLKMLALAANRQIIEYRQKRFIKLVSVTFPDKEDITFITVDSSDRRGMKRIEQELRDKYDLPERAT